MRDNDREMKRPVSCYSASVPSLISLSLCRLSIDHLYKTPSAIIFYSSFSILLHPPLPLLTSYSPLSPLLSCQSVFWYSDSRTVGRKWPLQARLLTNHNSKQAVLWKYGIQTTQCQNFWPPCRHPNSCRRWGPLMATNKEKETDRKKGQNNKRSSRRGVKNQKHAKQSFSSVCVEPETRLGLVFIRRNWEMRKTWCQHVSPPVPLWNGVSTPCRGLKSMQAKEVNAVKQEATGRDWEI